MRFRPHLVKPSAPEPHVTFQVVGGGVSANDVEHGCWLMFPHHGRYEDVLLRVFPPDGRVFEVRFSADSMREALQLVEQIRRSTDSPDRSSDA